MTPFSDQLSSVRQAQWQAQLDMFSKLTTHALESAGQLAALNVRATRATLEQATGTMKHMLEVRDPRDLFALGSAAQGQWQAVFSYGRELLGLAAPGLPAAMPFLSPAPTANVPSSYAQAMEQASIATADAATIGGEIAAAAVDIGAAHAEAALDAGNAARAQAEAAIDTAIADDAPPAEPTQLAKAVNEVASKQAGAGHALAAAPMPQTDEPVELPTVAPVDNVAPPPKASRGPRRK